MVFCLYSQKYIVLITLYLKYELLIITYRYLNCLNYLILITITIQLVGPRACLL